jgi:hypothetical protein
MELLTILHQCFREPNIKKFPYILLLPSIDAANIAVPLPLHFYHAFLHRYCWCYRKASINILMLDASQHQYIGGTRCIRRKVKTQHHL